MVNALFPSSTRPDGSKRKEIKILSGYKPPEDLEVYKNRTAEAWKNLCNRGGVPGAERLDDAKNGLGTGATATKNKNAKRREARKKAKDDGAHTKNGDYQAENPVGTQKSATNPI